jgi:hypothetical protein
MRQYFKVAQGLTALVQYLQIIFNKCQKT